MPIVAIIYNTKCLCCSDLEHEMVKVGPMTFCAECFKIEFIDQRAYNDKTTKVDSTNSRYKGWLDTYKRYINEKYRE